MMKQCLLILVFIALVSCTNNSDETFGIAEWTAGEDNAQARIALRNTTHKAAADKSLRKSHEQNLLTALTKAQNDEVRAFLIHELKLVGGQASIRPLMAYLSSESLCSHACMALLAINGSVKGKKLDFSVAQALSQALQTAEGKNLLHIVKTLGSVQEADQGALTQLTELFKSDDALLRRAAIRAVANIGKATSAAALLKTISVKVDYDRSKTVAYNLLFARNLAVADRNAAVKHVEVVKAGIDRDKESHLYIKCLSSLQDIKGKESAKELITHLSDKNKRIRCAVVDLLAGSKDPSLNSQLQKAFWSSDPIVKAEALKVLAARKHTPLTALIKEAMKSGNPYTRSVAVIAAVHGDEKELTPRLVQLILKGTEQDRELAAAALQRVSPQRSLDAILGILNGWHTEPKKTILKSFAFKKHPKFADAVFKLTLHSDKKVRKEAFSTLKNVAYFEQTPRLIAMILNSSTSTDHKGYQSALVTASSGRSSEVVEKIARKIELGSSEKSNMALVQVLGRVGGKQAFKVLLKLQSEGSEDVSMEAVRTLSKWSNIEQVEKLMSLLANVQGKANTLLVRGINGLINSEVTKKADKRKLLKKLSGLTTGKEKEKIVSQLKQMNQKKGKKQPPKKK